MRLSHLELSDYRNIQRASIDLSEGTVLLVGDNAQGKSNLLEAIYLLAAMKAPRAEVDSQLVRRGALQDPLPAARVDGRAVTAEGPLRVEVTVVARPGPRGPLATKTVKVNGVGMRTTGAIGRLTAVLFTAEDLEMIVGAPSGRRRYLDMTLAQVNARYATARPKFERVVTQRNSLLKRIREGLSRPDELEYWDDELAQSGAVLFRARAGVMGQVSAFAAEAHESLAAGERLSVQYRPRLEGGPDLESSEEEQVRELYLRELQQTVGRDIAAGMTLTGPHRDDVEFALEDLPATFASRAQQRTIALSLRLAEARFLRERRGEPPVLLLDDVLSEMDARRRESVLGALGEVDQMVVTGTDLDRFPASFRSGSAVFTIEGGSVQALAPGPPVART